MSLKQRWVTFEEQTPLHSKPAPKTKRFTVLGSRGEGDLIGLVRWSGTWRQYIFESFSATYNPACLREIADFVETQTREWRSA